MKRKKGSEIELTIDALSFGGKGIGQLEDGYKVFVAGVAVGDKVRASFRKLKTKYGEAKLEEILEPSPMRVAPKCAHFDTCGGCKWQFLPYEEQVKVKEQQVRDSVERIGGLSGELVQTIIANESPWYYRNKMELSFGPGRTEGSEEEFAMLGFYPPGYHYEVFDLTECHLMNEWMGELVGLVRDFAKRNNLPIYKSDTHEGLLRNLLIREGKNTGEIMVNLVTSTSPFEGQEALKTLLEGHEFGENKQRITSLYWTTVYQHPGTPTWKESTLLSGKKTLTEVLRLDNGQELSFEILPDAFFQTNTRQAEVLYSKVVELAGLSGEEIVFDLYCGTGTIGLFCAHKAKQVVGVEVNESAVDNARDNALKNGIKNASFYLGSVEDRLKNLKQKPDVVIVDPPRSGLGEKVVEKCSEFGAGRIVYVSCNPSTMARDLKAFAELGYTTKSIHPVDMFPQTAHIECVCLLES